MQLKNKLIYSGIISVVTLIASIFIPIIPCRIAPGVPNPIYKWTLCSLNPDGISNAEFIIEYFGYTTILKNTFILTFILTFIVVMIFFHYTTGKKKKD